MIGSKSVRHQMAMRVCFSIFLVGVVYVTGIMLMCALVATVFVFHQQTTTLLFIAFYGICMSAFASVIAYVVIRIRPHLAATEIKYFIASQKDLVSFFEEAIKQWSANQATLEQQDVATMLQERGGLETLTKTWEAAWEADRSIHIKRQREQLAQLAASHASLPPEVVLRNQQLCIEMHAKLREAEAAIACIEDEPTPPLPQSIKDAFLQKAGLELTEYLNNVRDEVRKTIAGLERDLSTARAAIAEAEKLL